jgi:hypothetical protein
MPRKRRIARRKRQVRITEDERLWALGENPAEEFFMSAARAREVWKAVHGEDSEPWADDTA